MLHHPAGTRSLQGPLTVAAAIVLLAGAILVAQALVAIIAFGTVAAVICRRIQLWLIGRGMGGALALTITVGGFVVIIGIMFLAVVASAAVIAGSLAEHSASLREAPAALAERLGLPGALGGAAAPSVDVDALVAALRSFLSAAVPVVSGLVMAILVVIYLLYDAGRLRPRMLAATSADAIRRYDILAAELVTYIRVRAILGAAAAVADTALLLLLGVPYAVLWGLLSFLLSFIPNIGFVLALIPPTLFAFFGGGWGAALAVVGGYVVINLAFDYVLQPRVMASSLDLSPVVVIVAILVWTFLVGPLGALLAVPLTIALRAALLPFPGARWFVALLGPVPAWSDEALPGSGQAAEPTIGA